MVLLANVALTDTFDIWRQRTNQIIIELNRLETEDDGTIASAFLKANQVGEAVTTANTNITNLGGAVVTVNTNVTAVTSDVANLKGVAVTSNSNITAAFLKANQVGEAVTTANAAIGSAFLKANQVGEAVTTANAQIVIAYNTANLSFTTANLAFGKANTALQNTTTTLDGTLTVTGSVIDSLGNLRDVPFNTQTAAYVLQSSDQGKVVSITTGGITVPNAVFSQGDNITIYNASFSTQTIASASDVTMYLVGTANTITRTLAQRGVATILCVAANTFVITGGGLT